MTEDKGGEEEARERRRIKMRKRKKGDEAERKQELKQLPQKHIIIRTGSR